MGAMGIGEGMAIAGGIGGGTSILNGILGSNAASNASQQAAAGENAALMAGIGGTQAAQNVLGPYYSGGLTNYDLLNLLMTGQNPSNAYASTNVSQILPSFLAPTSDINQAIGELNDYINNYASTRGGQSGKYGAQLEQAQSALSQLQNLQQQSSAGTAAQNALTASGLQPGALLNMLSTPFSYNVATDPNMKAASDFANQQIASQNAASGGYGSGNMASSIAQEIAGTLEPTYYNQAYQTYNTNGPGMAQNIIGALESNTGGSGQNVANSLASLYTGQAANAGQYLSGIGNAQASGTLGASNAWTNALTGLGTQANSLIGMDLNYQNSQGIKNALQQLAASGNWGGNYNSLISPYGSIGAGLDFNLP